MGNNRRAGTVFLKVTGKVQDAKGAFDYNLGGEVRTAIIGQDGVHGYTVAHQPAFIAGSITDSQSLDLEELVSGEDLTVTLELANGKTVVLHEAWWAGEGTVNTAEAEIPVRWEGKRGEEF